MTTNAFDVQRARRDTPACEQLIHFNNAGASPMPEPVFNAVVEHLRLETQTGGYEAAEAAQARIEHVYDAAARLINCSRDEIAVIENATRAWDMAFYSVPFKPGDRILSLVSEYASNYIAFLQVAKRCGAVVEVIPNDEHGQVSLEALEKALDERVKLISITHVPTNSGLVNPAARVGQIARKHGILYLLDACQSIGQMPIDVEEIGWDMLSVTGRKFLRGPRGTGFLYVRRCRLDELEPPFLDLHAATWTAKERYEIRPDARRFENWETYVAGKIGLGAAIDYALGWGLDNIRARVVALADELRLRLSRIPGVQVRDLGEEKCAIVTFTVAGRDPEDLRLRLAGRRVNVSVSMDKYSRIDMTARGIPSMLRASVHYYNTEEEIERFCAHVAELSG